MKEKKTIEKIIFLFLLVSIFFVSLDVMNVIAEDVEEPVKVEEEVINQNVITPYIYLEKLNYIEGEEKIQVYLQNGNQEIVLQKGACEEWFKIFDEKGNQLHLSDPTQPCILIIQSISIKPYEKKYLGSWDQQYWQISSSEEDCDNNKCKVISQKAQLVKAKPGYYYIQVDIVEPENIQSLKAKFEILKVVPAPQPSPDYLSVRVVPQTRTITYGEKAVYDVYLKDNHPKIVCVRAPCPQPEYEYNIEVKNLPFSAVYPKKISIMPGAEEHFLLSIDAYSLPEPVPIPAGVETTAIETEQGQIKQTAVSSKYMAKAPSLEKSSKLTDTEKTENTISVSAITTQIKPSVVRMKTQNIETLKEALNEQKKYAVSERKTIKVATPTESQSREIRQATVQKVMPEYQTKIDAEPQLSQPVEQPVETKIVEQQPSFVSDYLTRKYNFKLVVYSNELNVEEIKNLQLIIKPAPQPKPPEFPEEEYAMIYLKTGWNLISLPGPLEKFELIKTPKHKLIGFVFIKEKQQYMTLNEAREYLGKKFYDYLAKNAFWIYAYEPTELVAKINSKISYENMELYPKWNLLPVTEDLVYGQFSNIVGNCNVEALYVWDAANQQWLKHDISQSFDTQYLYSGIALKVKDVCTLSGGAVIEPPDFPESTNSDSLPTTAEDIIEVQNDYCKHSETGMILSWKQAKNIAEQSECKKYGTISEEKWCNEITGTMWFKLYMFEEKENCNPACVINIEDQSAEINWMCTGAIV